MNTPAVYLAFTRIFSLVSVKFLIYANSRQIFDFLSRSTKQAKRIDEVTNARVDQLSTLY